MLVELTIHDLALIESAELSLVGGLNVLTGETGAGKSLLVGSLELLSGRIPRGGAAHWVRNGAERARVEGRFRLQGEGRERVRSWLARELPEIEAELESEGGVSELILGRSLSREGRSRTHVDQRPVPLKALRALAPLLIEIHGQSEHQRLLDPAEQLLMLDAFGRLGGARDGYVEARRRWSELGERLARLDAEVGERRDRIELLRFQEAELSAAALTHGEHAALIEERALLRGAGELRRDLGGVLVALRDAEEGAQVDLLTTAERTLERWSKELPRLEASLADVATARVHLEEASAAIGSLLGSVNDDPRRLDAVEERLAELERLTQKYTTDEAGLIALLPALGAELSELEELGGSRDELQREHQGAHDALAGAAAVLSRKRRSLAPKLARKVVATLSALGLGKARFELAFELRGGEPESAFGPVGAEDVEFLLAANPGEEERPLRRVVSGGEAARIMLALRTVLSSCDSGRTLVFDEIDAGVGGRLGPEVGRHLEKLAGVHQVLCVTHLPAIAAVASAHLHAFKEVARGRTRTIVRTIQGEERVGEVADMIAGGAEHETARAEAKRLLGTG